jgi:hypothetical protein
MYSDAEFVVPINISFEAVFNKLRKTVVPCGEDSTITYNDAPDFCARVFAPESNLLGNSEKSLIPV